MMGKIKDTLEDLFFLEEELNVLDIDFDFEKWELEKLGMEEDLSHGK